MKTFRIAREVGLVVVFAAMTALVHAQSLSAATPTAASQGVHGFDFEYGRWRVHHRVKSAANDGTWREFDGTCTTRPFMAGQGDIEEHVFFRPSGNTYGTAMRAFDPKTEEWAIWWIDSRYPHFPLDPPAKGRFENGVGRFYSDSVVKGKTVRARLMWSQITPTSAHWEQANSDDAGKTRPIGSWSFGAYPEEPVLWGNPQLLWRITARNSLRENILNARRERARPERHIAQQNTTGGVTGAAILVPYSEERDRSTFRRSG
jgi:hypothetical protein